jgi:hypothetical protein
MFITLRWWKYDWLFNSPRIMDTRGSLEGSNPLFVIPANSLFSEFNSRLGRKNSLLALLVNCARKRLIWLADFLGQVTVCWRESKKFPVTTGKAGNSPPSTERSRQ